MAEAAAKAEANPFTAEQMCAAYERIRGEAKELNRRAFAGDDAKFDEELPPLPEDRSPGRISGPPTGASARRAFARGEAVRVLLGQLAAWASGLQETIEISARVKADAEARAAETAKRGQTGFG